MALVTISLMMTIIWTLETIADDVGTILAIKDYITL